MAKGLTQQKLATESAYWPLYRFDPRLAEQGGNPFQLDSRPPKIPFTDYALNETRYRLLQQVDPESSALLLRDAQTAIEERWRHYERLADRAGHSNGHSNARSSAHADQKES